MPLKRHRYNSNWALTSLRIRVERDGNKCRKCGVENLAIIRRLEGAHFRYMTEHEQNELKRYMQLRRLKYWDALKKLHLTRIVLTVAHLDHNEKNDSETNLLTMCQRCHFSFDKADNRLRQARNRSISKINQTTITYENP